MKYSTGFRNSSSLQSWAVFLLTIAINVLLPFLFIAIAIVFGEEGARTSIYRWGGAHQLQMETEVEQHLLEPFQDISKDFPWKFYSRREEIYDNTSNKTHRTFKCLQNHFHITIRLSYHLKLALPCVQTSAIEWMWDQNELWHGAPIRMYFDMSLLPPLLFGFSADPLITWDSTTDPRPPNNFDPSENFNLISGRLTRIPCNDFFFEKTLSFFQKNLKTISKIEVYCILCHSFDISANLYTMVPFASFLALSAHGTASRPSIYPLCLRAFYRAPPPVLLLRPIQLSRSGRG